MFNFTSKCYTWLNLQSGTDFKCIVGNHYFANTSKWKRLAYCTFATTFFFVNVFSVIHTRFWVLLLSSIIGSSSKFYSHKLSMPFYPDKSGFPRTFRPKPGQKITRFGFIRKYPDFSGFFANFSSLFPKKVRRNHGLKQIAIKYT